MAKVAKTSKADRLAKAKAKLKKLKDKGGGGGGSFPFQFLNFPEVKKKGDKVEKIIRIYPSWSKKADAEFYKEFTRHQDIGPDGKRANCPENIGKKCPLETKGKALQAEAKKFRKGDPKGQKLWAQGKDLMARSRVWTNANEIDPDTKQAIQTGGEDAGEPATKPEVFDFGPQVLKQILEIYTDQDIDPGGDFWDEDTLAPIYDFKITKEKTGNQAMNVEYHVAPVTKYKKVDTSEMLENLHDLDELVTFASPSDILAMMEGRDPDEDEEEDDDDEEELRKAEGDDEDDAPARKAAGKKKKPSKDEDEDEEEEEEEDDEEDDNDDDDDEEESDDDDDSDDDDEEEDDSDDDEDDDDESKKKSKKKVTKEKVKKKKPSKDEDEDEEEEEDDEEDDEEESDDDSDDDDEEDAEEDDEEEPEEDSDDDDEDEDDDEEEDDDEVDEDDEEEAPKKKKGASPKAKGKVAKKAVKKPFKKGKK